MLLSALNYPVLRTIPRTVLWGWLEAVQKFAGPFCNLGCGVVESVQSAPEHSPGLSPDEAFEFASNGVLRSQAQLLGSAGGNFPVWLGRL